MDAVKFLSEAKRMCSNAGPCSTCDVNEFCGFMPEVSRDFGADIDCDWASTQCVRLDLAVGKTVFLTREEAEKALEEKKDD